MHRFYREKKNLVSLLFQKSQTGTDVKNNGLNIQVKSQLLLNLGLSFSREFDITSQGPITWIDIELIENRYILTASADRQIALYDLAAGPAKQQEGRSELSADKGPQRIKPVFRRRKAHKATVSSIQWYPVDTGLFVTSSMDGFVQIWDTNAFTSVSIFPAGCKVYTATLSPCSRTHNLVALGTDNSSIRLGDLSSEGWTHQLVGHLDEVWTVAWSPTNEYVLASGSMDRTVRLWDVRRSGASACLLSLCAQNDIIGQANEPPFHQQEGQRDRRKRQRQGPHFSQASNLARAHTKPINSIAFTPDGLFLLTSAMDGQLRCWNTTTGAHQLINYLGIKNTKKRQFKMAMFCCGRSHNTKLFYPNGEDGEVLLFDVHSPDGKPQRVLQGHFASVNCCAVREPTMELVTGGQDGMLVLWEYYNPIVPEEDFGSQEKKSSNLHSSDDEWSDDDRGSG